MSNEENAPVANPKSNPAFYVAKVVSTFSTKKEIEMHLMENTLGADEVIIKGKCVETRPSVSIV